MIDDSLRALERAVREAPDDEDVLIRCMTAAIRAGNSIVQIECWRFFFDRRFPDIAQVLEHCVELDKKLKPHELNERRPKVEEGINPGDLMWWWLCYGGPVAAGHLSSTKRPDHQLECEDLLKEAEIEPGSFLSLGRDWFAKEWRDYFAAT